MKKILTVLCSVGLLMAMPVNVFADEYEVKADGTKNVDLVANATSSYTVKIPKQVDVSDGDEDLTILAKGDIASDEKIAISYDDSNCALKDTSEATTKQEDVALTISFVDDVCDFLFDDIKGDFANNSKVVINIKHGGIPAGSFAAVLPITIALTSLA